MIEKFRCMFNVEPRELQERAFITDFKILSAIFYRSVWDWVHSFFEEEYRS